MGQSKSKSWRRLSESDCLHLLNEDSADGQTCLTSSNSSNTLQPNKTYRRENSTRRWSISPVNDRQNQFDSERNVPKYAKVCPNSKAAMRPTTKPNQSNQNGLNNKAKERLPSACQNNQLAVRNSFSPPPVTIVEPCLIDISPEKPTIPKVQSSAGVPPATNILLPVNASRSRPLSMYQFEPKATPNPKLRLSLTDLLERVNSFDETMQRLPELSMTPDEGEEKIREFDEEMESPKCGKSIRCSGLDCMCDRCVGVRFKLLNWLLPNCTRTNAERLLMGRMDGTFLVRKSEKIPGQYTLSFVCNRSVRHCLILRSVYGFGLRWPYSFETLQQVIMHYTTTPLSEFNSKLDVLLKYPVFTA